MARHWLLVIVALIVVTGAGSAVVARGLGLEPVKIDSNSMAPDVTAGEWIVVWDVDAESGSSVGRGDIVMFGFPPEHPTGDAIKRVVAIGGDTVTISRDQVAVNGNVVPDSAAPDVAAWARERTIHVPDGFVFLLGDNAPESIDSRAFGPLPEDQIRARHLLTLGPTRTILATTVAGTALVVVVLTVLGYLRRRPQPPSTEPVELNKAG